jgi:hypothetical protein
VQVESVATGDQRKCLLGVGPQLVGRSRLAGIVPGRRQSAAQSGPQLLEPANVVTLPAVQRDRDAGERSERLLDVDSVLGVAVPGGVVGAFNRIGHGPL